MAPDQVIISFLDADFNKRGERITPLLIRFHIFFLGAEAGTHLSIAPWLWSNWADDARTGKDYPMS